MKVVLAACIAVSALTMPAVAAQVTITTGPTPYWQERSEHYDWQSRDTFRGDEYQKNAWLKFTAFGIGVVTSSAVASAVLWSGGMIAAPEGAWQRKCLLSKICVCPLMISIDIGPAREARSPRCNRSQMSP